MPIRGDPDVELRRGQAGWVFAVPANGERTNLVAEMSPVERWIVNHASPLLSAGALRPFLRHHLTLPAGAARGGRP
jgi:hypothetical protein